MVQLSTLNQDAGEEQYKKIQKPGKKRKPTELEQDPEVMILAPKTKPPRDDKEVPNFLELCSLKVEHEEMAGYWQVSIRDWKSLNCSSKNYLIRLEMAAASSIP